MPRRATYVYPSGDPSTARLAIVGEQPGRREIHSRKPFTGPAGKELDNCLHNAGIPRSDCYLTNVIKDLDRPLSNYISMTRKGPVVSDLGAEYMSELEQELSHVNAEVIVPLGNVALFALTDRTGITKWRGSILHPTIAGEKYVVPSFHPATVIPPKNQYLNKHLITFDLKRAWEIVTGEYTPTPRQVITKPTYIQSNAFLTEAYHAGLIGTIIDYDIEISNMEVSCISFAIGHKAICIPFVDGKGDYFDPEQEVELWKLIANILEDDRVAIRGQNLSFDVHFLLRKFGIKASNLHDTMVAQRILMPDFKIGLDFITSIWTDIPYYKEDGKFWLKGVGSWERGWEYNAYDSLACSDAGPKQLDALKTQNNLETYDRTRKIILPLVYMQEHGIRMDVRGMVDAYDELGHDIDNMRTELNLMCGRELNANSPVQLKDYFYKTLGLPPYKNKGSITTNESAMIRIGRKGYAEAWKILDIRRAVKKRSTYLDPAKLDTDGRLRCSYNPVGTRFSRISSSENIFGTGNNLQNQPHDILRYFLADKGYVLYELDLSQAENRIVAYVGRIEAMIKAFEEGRDVHSLTAALISNKSPQEVRDEHDAGILCALGKGDKTWRYWGKKANHSLNYDEGYKTFALQNEIPESQGKMIIMAYHSAYPGVRNRFHSHVKSCITKDRTLTNLMGRRTTFMGNISSPMERDKIFKQAYSCIPQGTVGDIINERGMNYVYYNERFADVELLMQVHDSIKFQIPLSLGWYKHSVILSDIKRELETPLITHYGREFVIPCDIQMGLNMGEMVEVEPDPVVLERAFNSLRPMKEYKEMWK